MSHRGPLREIFGIICLSLNFKETDRNRPPVTHYLMDVIEPTNNITIPSPLPTRPPTTNILLLILSFLAPALSIIAEEVLYLFILWILTNGRFPNIGAVTNFLASLVVRQAPDGAAGQNTRQPTPSEAEDDEDEWFDAQEPLPSSDKGPDNTPPSPVETQLLADLRAESAQKDARIASLIKNANSKGDEIADLHTRQLSSVYEVDRIKEAAESKEKTLRERAIAAEREVRLAVMPWQHDIARNQLEEAAVELRKVNGEKEVAVGAQERLTNDLRAEKARIQELQSELAATQQPESLSTTTKAELQIANENIANLERQASTGIEGVRDAERKAQVAERNAAESATMVSQLEQELREARNEAEELRKSNEQAEENAAAIEEALKKKSGKAPVNGGSEEQIAEIESLRAKLADANKQVSDRDQQDADRREAEPRIFQQGYEEAVEVCKVEARELVSRAREQEANEATQRTTDALAQQQEAMKKEILEKWNAWEGELKAECEGLVKKAQNEAIQVTEAGQVEWNRAEGEKKRAQEELGRAEGEKRRAEEEWGRAEGQKKRAEDAEANAAAEASRAQMAEAEIEKYKNGRDSQTARIGNLNDEIKSLRAQVATATPNSLQQEVKAKALTASQHDLQRARNLIGELVNRHYDSDSRLVLTQLIGANAKIAELRSVVTKSSTKPDQRHYLTILQHAEVDRSSTVYLALEHQYRHVLVKQCEAANGKLVALKEVIKLHDQPERREVLEEIFKVRGDELVEWNDLEAAESEESDEDEDENSAAGTPEPGPQPRKLRPVHGRRPAPKTGGKDAPTSGNSKQGSSCAEFDDDQNEAEPKSQSDPPSSERIGEATAPEQQSNDQIDFSPQMPGSSSLSSHSFTPMNSTFTPIDPPHWSGLPSHSEHAFHSKHTKIPGPKPKAYQTPSQRQQRLAARQDEDKETASTEEATIASSAEGSTGFTFSAPKDVASGILPHVRKYTRLSGKTNTILSRHGLHTTATAESTLPRTIAIRRGDGGQSGTARTCTSGRRGL